MKVYADDGFYKDKYLLGRKPAISAGFNFYARSASRIMNSLTFGRIDKLNDLTEDIKMCCCEIAERCYTIEKERKAAGGKTSEKIGTYSATFSDKVLSDTEISTTDAYRIMNKWLSETGLLYRGI
ncbi:hypothetical protein [Lacrimispora sp.]|uniref:hypothetical protein n=1 Tax=Lacrimispora sp. TaxID=2719234 RepID=UPI0028AD5113|nr:hypothetical protein [Lacrimispora sp.]